MIFDYFELEKYVQIAQKPNFSCLHDTGVRYPNVVKYEYRGFFPLAVFWNGKTRFLKIQGSFAMTLQGHNFCFGLEELEMSIDLLGAILEIDLLDAQINKLEVGILIEVVGPPMDIINRHLKIQGMKMKMYDHGRYFEDATLKVKMYDAGKRLKEIIPKSVREEMEKEYGYAPNASYLRFEIHHKKPEILFKSRMNLAQLLNGYFTSFLKETMFQTYQKIMKSSYEIPTQKRDLSVSSICLIALKDAEGRFGFDAEQLLFSILNSIPETILPKEDRKKRRAKIKKDLQKLRSEKPPTEWDIEEKIKNKLKI